MCRIYIFSVGFLAAPCMIYRSGTSSETDRFLHSLY